MQHRSFKIRVVECEFTTIYEEKNCGTWKNSCAFCRNVESITNGLLTKTRSELLGVSIGLAWKRQVNVSIMFEVMPDRMFNKHMNKENVNLRPRRDERIRCSYVRLHMGAHIVRCGLASSSTKELGKQQETTYNSNEKICSF